MAKSFKWQIIERPAEGEEPKLNALTLEDLGLGRLRPAPPVEVLKTVDDEGLICETCVNRHNPPGSGPCGRCDLTIDGEASEYRPEPEETVDDLDEQPVDEQPVDEQAADEQPADEQSVDEQSVDPLDEPLEET
jgi:hypothetical protein